MARGGLYILRCDEVVLDGCTFDGNINPDGFGGAFFSWNSTDVVMQNCNFTQNQAQNGACMYIDGREILDHNTDRFIFDNCTFEGNQANGWGGGCIYNWRSSYTMTGCTFFGNSAVNTGGAIYNGGDEKSIIIQNTNFESGMAGGNDGGWGGAFVNYGNNSNLLVENCTFEGNQAVTSGAGVATGFLANTTIDNSLFKDNAANFGGGLYVQNDTSQLTVRNSNFQAIRLIIQEGLSD